MTVTYLFGVLVVDICLVFLFCFAMLLVLKVIAFHVFYSRHPEVKWAETTDKIFLTIVLADSKDTKVNLDPEGVLDFSAKAGPEDHVYELKLELHDKVNVEVIFLD